MIYSAPTEQQVRSQIDELEKAIALLPKDFTLSIGLLQKQLDDRADYLKRQQTERDIRISQAAVERERPRNTVEVSPQQMIAGLLNHRSLLSRQLDMTLPLSKPEIQGRIDEIDLEIKNLQERIDLEIKNLQERIDRERQL